MGKKIAITLLISLIPVIVILIIITSLILSIITLIGSEQSGVGEICETVSVINTENYKYDKEDILFEDYIAGVVAAESNGSNNIEYLKLAAIATRSDIYTNISSDCTVEGNSNFHKYIDIEDSINSELVKQAVEETKDLVITKNKNLVKTNYNLGCLINVDTNYYYLRIKSSDIQKIPKSWVQLNGLKSELDYLYSQVDKSETDYTKRACPENTYDNGITQIGAMYLINNQGYSYKDVIRYYNKEEVEITEKKINHIGNGDFINPTSSIYCSSPYGYRTHPVKGETLFHSGIDIGISGGSPIYAAKSGTITRIEKNVTAINNCNYGYGNYIVIDHGDGSSTLYAHMKYGTIPNSLYNGAIVSQGTQIGQVGSTGCSTGNHLHYEVLINGSTIDPANYLNLTNASGTCKR